MPQRKKYEGYEHRNIPPFVLPTPEIISSFQNHLLELPFFKRKGDSIYLRSPEYPQTVDLRENFEQLLSCLSSALAFFFRDIRIDPTSFSETMTKMTEALSNLSSCKNELITSGMVDEKTFKKTFDRINKWKEGYFQHIERPISPEKRTRLVRNLYNCFEECVPKFSDKGKFYCIAHILESFGIEEGEIEQIFGRIKKDYYRKKNKGLKSTFSIS